MSSTVKSGNCLMAFPTIILQRMLEGGLWAERVADHAWRALEREPGIQVSQRGGWHSTGNVFQQLEGQLVPLLSAIDEALRELWSLVGFTRARSYGLDGWLNVLGIGGFHRAHQHPRASWAGVFYLHAAEGCAELELLDPRPPDFGTRSSDRVCLAARTGLLVLFPGSTWHGVAPHAGPSPRISLAFNVYLDGADLCVS